MVLGEHEGVRALLSAHDSAEHAHVVLRSFVCSVSRLEHHVPHSERVPHLPVFDGAPEVSFTRDCLWFRSLPDFGAHLLRHCSHRVVLLLPCVDHELLRRLHSLVCNV